MCNCKSNGICGCNLCCNIIKNIFGISYPCPAKGKSSVESVSKTSAISLEESKDSKSSPKKKATTRTKKSADKPATKKTTTKTKK